MNITSRFNWWLRKGVYLRDFRYMLPKLVLYLFLVSLAGGIVSALFLGPNEILAPAAQGLKDTQHTGFLKTLEFLIWTPFVDEFVRAAVLTIVLMSLERWGWHDNVRGLYVVLAVVAVLSVVYGYLVPSWNALSQALAGIAYSIVFLKWSRYGARLDDGFTAAWTAHIAYNTCVVGVSYLGVWTLTFA